VTAENAFYFKHRRESADSTLHYTIPVYLESSLPVDRSARILDFGPFVYVPNAQSNTGSYWAEDFTHHTLFTSGSLYCVLSKAGFAQVEFIDADCTAGMRPRRRWLKRRLLTIHTANYRSWNRVTFSATHPPSPEIFSYEIKAVARP
jgi:hypothetical protein